MPPSVTDNPSVSDGTDATADLSRGQQRTVVAQHITEWKQARYSAEISHRVQRKLGGGPDTLAPLLKRMEECEQAIDELQIIQAELA